MAKKTEARGWMSGVTQIPIPIFPDDNARGGYGDHPQGSLQAKGIMHHVVSGFVDPTLNQWMQTGEGPEISCHFGITRDGRIFQYASVFDATWHAGIVNKPTWPLYDNTSPNKTLVGIEVEGFSKPGVSWADYVYDDNKPWPMKMVEALIEVTKFCLEQHNLEASTLTIIGHNELDSVTRAEDPGKMWPQQKIIDTILGYREEEWQNDNSQKGPDTDHNLDIALAHLRDAITNIESARKAE